MKTISIVNRKGGVGKTATAQALGSGLLKRGYRVLFVDLDSQSNLSYAIGVDTIGLSSLELMTETATAKEVIIKTDQGDIIPASPNLVIIETTLTETGKEYRLKERLEPILSEYDYIIIDTPAQLGVLTINALTTSDFAIIPVQADIYSLQGIGLLNETIETIKKYCNKDLYIDGVLVTRYNGRAVLSRDMQGNIEELAKEFHTKVYKTPIRECIAIKESQAMRQSIFDFAPRSNASIDYDNFINEILEGR